MTKQDRQEEMGAALAQIAMIAEEVNLLALAGSSARQTYDEQLACLAEVQRRVREMIVQGLPVTCRTVLILITKPSFKRREYVTECK